MISVKKSDASDEKTSTESESSEGEQVSKLDGLGTKEANPDASDDLRNSDQANNPVFDNSGSQSISPVSSQGSEKSPDPEVHESGGQTIGQTLMWISQFLMSLN